VVRGTAAQSLARVAGASEIPLLLDLSHDTNDRIRQAALSAFSTIGKDKKDVTDRLIAALDGPDRMAAMSALGARREVSAVPLLQRIADTEVLPGVVRAARAAIEAIRAPEKK
jgi:HEAT repeat protein